MVHRAVWDNAHVFWHPENRFQKQWLDVEQALEEKRQEEESSMRSHYSPTDLLFDALRKQFTTCCVGLLFRELIDPKPENQACQLDQQKYSFLGRSRFMEKLLSEMVAGEWTEKKLQVLTRMVLIFTSSMLTSRPVMPAQVWLEQFPHLGARKQVYQLFAQLSSHLVLDEQARQQENQHWLTQPLKREPKNS